MTLAPGWHREGKATFLTNTAFYRPQSQVGRDLAILAAAIYRRQNGQLRVLDAMTGCGVRPLRYQLEAGADWVWANEANPDHREVLLHNLAAGMQPRSYRITHQDANQVFFACYQQRDFYDLVDIDNFGSPAPYASTGMWATRIGGLLYLTSTDGRSTSGHDPDRSLQTFGTFARSHPAVHEQGLRMLIGHAMQQAAAKGFHIQPIFSLFNGQVHRAMVRLMLGTVWNSDLYGFIGYCHVCGHFQTVDWRHLGRVRCACHQDMGTYIKPHPLVLSGPLWLGPLHDRSMLTSMESLAADWGWQKRVKLLQIMQAEAEMPPYYYPLGEIGRLGQMDIPRREGLIQALCDRNFQASLTHLSWEAIKTDATMAECVDVAKSCQVRGGQSP